MLIVTTEYVSGKETEMLGLVKGSTIQTVNAFKDIGAGLKTLICGELTKYNEIMDVCLHAGGAAYAVLWKRRIKKRHIIQLVRMNDAKHSFRKINLPLVSSYRESILVQPVIMPQ